MKRRDLLTGAAGGAVAATAVTSLTGCKDDTEAKKAMEEASKLKTELELANAKISELEQAVTVA